MAISTYRTYLMVKGDSGDTWTKVIDIKEFPDLGGAPEMLETTTLSDEKQTYIPGIQSLDALEFNTNYTLEDYTRLVENYKGKEKTYAVWFGASDAAATAAPSGENGKFQFNGQLDVYAAGGGVNAVVEMKVTIAPSTPIRLVA